MPRRKTFRRRQQKKKVFQKGGALTSHWLKVTRKSSSNVSKASATSNNDYEIDVEIIDETVKNELCDASSSSGSSSSSSSSSSSISSSASAIPLIYTFDSSSSSSPSVFNQFVFEQDLETNSGKILLLKLSDDKNDFNKPFELTDLHSITKDQIDFNCVESKGC